MGGTSTPRMPESFTGLRGDPIQVLSPVASKHQAFAIGAVSARSAAIPDNAVVEVNSSVDCFIRFGDAAVDAVVDDHPVWAKTPVPYSMNSSAYIAAITSGAAGKFYISVLE